MTNKELLDMYQEKKAFVQNINEVFQMEPRCPSVVGVTYEVFSKTGDSTGADIREWIVVHFADGGKSPKLVSGNSNIANFRTIGSLLNGGFYTEVKCYEEQVNNGYQQLLLD